PSAAPVATPSNRASTAFIFGSLSRAATKCISLVPGLVKQTSTPASTRVFIRACAPFVIVILRGLHQFVRVVFLQRSRNTAVSRRQYVLVGSAASSLAQTLTLCGFCFP